MSREFVRTTVFDEKMSEYSYFDRLAKSINQAISFKQGDKSNAKVSVRARTIPEYCANDVYRMRTELRLSQRSLAVVLGVSPRTVEAWEAGRNSPNGPAARMLYLIESDKSIIGKLTTL